MLTTREYALKNGYEQGTVAYWCRKGRLRGTVKVPIVNNLGTGFMYLIPENAPPPSMRRGDPRRKKFGVAESITCPNTSKRSKREINIFIRNHCKEMTYGQMSKVLGIPTLKLREMYDYLHERDGI